MANLKTQEKSRLAYEFGFLVQPFEDLVRGDSLPSVTDYRISIAKVQGGISSFVGAVERFVTFADDVVFKAESNDVRRLLGRFLPQANNLINDVKLNGDLGELKSMFASEFDLVKCRYFELIDQVPVEWEPEIFAANTPFAAYIRVTEAISSARKRIHYFDSYLKPEFFHQFLANLSRSVEIRLITTLGNNGYGVKSVEHVSKLVAVEFSNYQLIEVAPKTIHDRNLRIDDIIFSLGPGIDRAGFALTNFGPTDSSNEAHHEFDGIIRKGNVIHHS